MCQPLRLLRERPGADDTEVKHDGIAHSRVFPHDADAQVQPTGVRTIVRDQGGELGIVGRVNVLADRQHQILLVFRLVDVGQHIQDATSRDQADRVVGALKTANFSSNDISVLFPDKGSTRDFAHEKNTKAPEGAVAGAGTGGVVGGALGWVAGIGALAIPGVGPFIAAGPIIAALSGAAIGAAVGGIAGGLIGLGIKVSGYALRPAEPAYSGV